MKKRNGCSDKFSVYSDMCLFFNVLTTLLMTVGSGFIMHFIGLDNVTVVIGCIVLFWVYAWIEEHHISRFINTAIEKILKIDL